MQKKFEGIDKILPFGELIRGFSNQNSISKGDLKRTLRDRGIFLPSAEKEQMVPCLVTLLLSPSEFDNLRECQNTREDTYKKSSSRIEWSSPRALLDVLPNDFPLEELIPIDYSNYKFISSPTVHAIDNNRDKIKIEYKIERFDLNKSWYESQNIFSGNIVVEKISDTEIQIIKTYTSSETDEVGVKLQNYLVKHYKQHRCIDDNKELDKILFSIFSNESRIVFFWRLTTNMSNKTFECQDIIDIEFRPDPEQKLPENIEWMYDKNELIIKGRSLHNTFFIKEKEYHKYLQFWSLEAKFNFNYLGQEGSLVASFEFSDFAKKRLNAEFEIKISSLSFINQLEAREKDKIKQILLEDLENQKNEIFKKYMEYLKKEEPSGS